MSTQDSLSDGQSFVREVAIAYCFPLAMFAMAIIPGCNRAYSGHGGLAWFVVPLCFPFVIIRALFKCFSGSDAAQAWFRRFYLQTIPAYVAISAPLSWAAAASIHNAFGLVVSPWALFMLMVSPVPWLYFM